MAADLNHRPRPGPLQWDWLCLTCSQPVADHPRWWRRRRASTSGGTPQGLKTPHSLPEEWLWMGLALLFCLVLVLVGTDL